MFTINARKLVRKIWGSSVMAIPPRPAIKLWLEALEERTLPSASPTNAQPLNSTASPQAVSAAEAITSYLITMMEQRIATMEQDLSNALYTVGQVIAQEEYSFAAELGSILGFNFTGPQPSQSSAATPPGSGAATTTHDAPAPTPSSSTPSPVSTGRT